MVNAARWCFTHRKVVLAAWLIALIGLLAISQAVKATYNNAFSLPGTDSTAAQNVFTADFPVHAGDSEQIVVQATQGTLHSAAVQASVTSMLAKVSHLPHVSSVTSPYTSPGQISKDGTIGFATVALDEAASTIPKAAVTNLISTATAADSASVKVALGGQAIEYYEPQGAASSGFLLGVVLALVVLFFAFRRSILGAILPLISALMGIGVAFSIIGILTHAISVSYFEPYVTGLVSLGVGVDYALFIVSRYRSGLLAGRTPEEAAVTAFNTSGRAVLLAGLTVCVALLGLFALQVSFLYGVAVSVTVAVALTMLASLTLLPAMLGFFGYKVLRRGERKAIGHQDQHATGFWLRWANFVHRRAAVLSVLALGIIVVLAIPFFSIRQGLPDASTDQASSTTRQAYDLLAKGFGPGFGGPLDVVATVQTPADQAKFASFVTGLRGQPGVARVQPPQLSPNGKADLAVVYPTSGPQAAQTADLLNRVRSAASGAQAGTTMKIYVGGTTAVNEDFSQVLSSRLPQFVAVVVALGFLLLAIMFRSLLIPLLASVMNFLAFGAALGVMTAGFQFGWAKSVLGFGETGPVVSWLPVLMFAILFGLSMDYEVFLISRMHEEWTRSHDNTRAVTRGQAETGGVITAAALIMILVFASFTFVGAFDIKQIGLGFMAAVLLDAFIIRTILVPASMHLFGRANWWRPGWLDRILPRLHMEPADIPAQPADSVRTV